MACSTLDAALGDAPIAMLKLDVEGAEPLVLRGAKAHLTAANPPVMQIEMDGYSARYGLATHDFIDELAAAGYDVALYDPEANRLLATRCPWEHGVLNVLAIHRAAWAGVESRLAARPGSA